MAVSKVAILLLLLTLLVSSSGSLVAAADVDCTTPLAGCAAYLGNSTGTPDQKLCCAPLNTVLTTPSSFQCLCDQLSKSGSTTSQLIQSALLLPKRCNLTVNVSEANCTSSSSSNATSSSPTSAGFSNASSWTHLVALALFGAFIFLLA